MVGAIASSPFKGDPLSVAIRMTSRGLRAHTACAVRCGAHFDELEAETGDQRQQSLEGVGHRTARERSLRNR